MHPEKERENELKRQMMIRNRKDITSNKEDIITKEQTKRERETREAATVRMKPVIVCMCMNANIRSTLLSIHTHTYLDFLLGCAPVTSMMALSYLLHAKKNEKKTCVSSAET